MVGVVPAVWSWLGGEGNADPTFLFASFDLGVAEYKLVVDAVLIFIVAGQKWNLSAVDAASIRHHGFEFTVEVVEVAQ